MIGQAAQVIFILAQLTPPLDAVERGAPGGE